MTTLVQEVAPPHDDQGARQDDCGIPGCLAEARAGVTKDLLQHEAPDARPRVDGRENEERFEHDGEMIPQGRQSAAPQERRGTREYLRHANGERRRAARPARQ